MPSTTHRPAAHPVGRAAVGGAAAVATIALLGVGLWIVARARWEAVASPGPAEPADGLTLLLAGLALVLLAWLVLGLVLEALAALPGRRGAAARRAADRLAPALATRIAAFVLGTALTTTLLPGTAVAGLAGPFASRPGGVGVSRALSAATGSPACDGPAPAPDPAFTASDAAAPERASAPSPGFVADRPVVRPVLCPQLLDRSGVAAPRGVVVHRGDSLWSIAAAALGPDASDAEVARAWPRWYAANRHVIGPDPDLILPGQVLRVPAAQPR